MFDNSSNVIDTLKTYGTLIALILLFSFLSPVFLSWGNLSNILVATVTIGLLAMSASMVIGSAGLDLSVGSVLALSACIAVTLSTALDLHWVTIIFLCLTTGIVIGAINGAIIAYTYIPAFITTLGMMGIARGLSYIITDGRPLYGLPEPIIFIGQGSFLFIPIPIWIFAFTGITLHILLRYTLFGQHTLAIGDNEKAVKNAGIHVQFHKIKLYALSGFFAALAGLVFMGRINAADPSAGLMYEMTAITGAILGGTYLFGGRASIIGAIVGALIMGVLQNGLTLLAIPSYYQQVTIGVVLILAVWLDQFAKNK